MSASTLLFRVRPVHGESFTSYVDRLAHAQPLPLHTLLSAVGVTADEHHKSIPRAYGIWLSSQQIRRFAGAAGLPEETIQRMLLSSYDGVCIDLSAVEARGAAALRVAAIGGWFYSRGSQACPACLAETDGVSGVWQLKWKLPWSFACVRHRKLLVSDCPSCEERLGNGRPDGRTAPIHMAKVPSPGTCQAREPRGRAAKGLAAQACGFVLANAPMVDLGRDSAVLKAQARLDERLAVTNGSAEAPTAFAYFERLRSAVALILSIGELDGLEIAAPTVSAWRAFVAERDALAESRRSSAAPRRGRRHRAYISPPDDAALLAAVIPRAMSIADLDRSDRATARELLAPLVESARRLKPQHVDAVPLWFRLPDDLAAAWSELRAGAAGRYRNRVRGAIQVPELSPDCVPQLINQARYERNFAPMVVPLSPRYGRRFVSMALLVAAGLAETWTDAGRVLRMAERDSRALANRGVVALNRSNARAEFDLALEREVQQLAVEQTDFRLRERIFSDFSRIEDEAWAAISRRASVPVRAGGRSRHAAAWLWSELVQGDWHDAPAYAGSPSPSDVECMRRFLMKDLPVFEAPLRAYGRRLLSDEWLADTDSGRQRG